MLRSARPYRFQARLDDHELRTRFCDDPRQAVQFLARFYPRHFEPEGATDQHKIRIGKHGADGAARILALLLDPDRGVAAVLGENHLERQLALHRDRKLVAGHEESAVADKADDGACWL